MLNFIFNFNTNLNLNLNLNQTPPTLSLSALKRTPCLRPNGDHFSPRLHMNRGAVPSRHDPRLFSRSAQGPGGRFPQRRHRLR